MKKDEKKNVGKTMRPILTLYDGPHWWDSCIVLFMKYSLNWEVVIGYWKTIGYQLVHNCLTGYFARSYKRE